MLNVALSMTKSVSLILYYANNNKGELKLR